MVNVRKVTMPKQDRPPFIRNWADQVLVLKDGKIAAVGSRMIEGAARVLIGAFFEALARRAGGEWWRC